MSALSGILYGLQCRTRSMCKHSSRVSYSLSSIGHPPHKRGCMSSLVFDLQSRSSLRIFLLMYCLLCLCMSLWTDLANGGLVFVLLYRS